MIIHTNWNHTRYDGMVIMLTRNILGILWEVHSPCHYKMVGYDIDARFDGIGWTVDKTEGYYDNMISISEEINANTGFYQQNHAIIDTRSKDEIAADYLSQISDDGILYAVDKDGMLTIKNIDNHCKS